MGVSNLTGLFALASLPIILFLYLFRPKHKFREVPSIYLWKELMEEISQAKKLDRLKKSLLLFLDLLIALLIGLLLMGIFFFSSKSEEHQVIVLNASFSMNAQDIRPNRFERAKELAIEYVEKLEGNSKISLISLEGRARVICEKEEDRELAVKKIRALKPSYERADLSGLQELLSEWRRKEKLTVSYFTDKAMPSAENIIVKESDDNLALRGISSRKSGGKVHVLVRIENESDREKTAQVSLYDDKLYLSTLSVKVPAKGSEQLFFENISDKIPILRAELDGKDINPHDDRVYEIRNAQNKKKIALVSEGHFFLERFLKLNETYELYLIRPNEYQALSDCDLYIFDKFVPEKVPEANILFLDPERESKGLFSASGYIESPKFRSEKHRINRFLEKPNYAIGISQTFTAANDREAILSGEKGLLAFSTKKGSHNIVVFGFDFRYSDLPLKADFPILMSNLSEFLLEDAMTDKSSYEAGESVKIFLNPSCRSARILSPSQNIFPLETGQSAKSFHGARELGLYTVEQKSNFGQREETKFGYFAINPPSFSENASTETADETAKIVEFRSKKDIDLILTLLAVLLLLMELWIRIKKSPLTNKTPTALRLFAILLILLSLSDLKLQFSSKYSETVFVMDYSESMHKKETELEQFVENAFRAAPEGERLGILSFAGQTNVEKTLSEEKTFQKILPQFDRGASNIERAVERAELMFNKDRKKRIVLLTDGRENAGDFMKMLDEWQEKKIGLDLYLTQDQGMEEIQLDEIQIPRRARKGESISVEAKISSNVASSAKIYLHERGKLIEKKDVEIEAGTNRFSFSVKPESTGVLEYRLEIVPDRDSYVQNNKLSAFVKVEGNLKLLIVQNKDRGKNFAKIFEDFEVDLVSQEEAPVKEESLIHYDAFVFADVNLEQCNPKLIETISRLVRDQGKSLLVSGGQESFALGGYHKSKLEEMLPVEMKVKDRKKEENIAMLLVIDKSGSMASGEYGVNGISLAKEAAIRANEVLEEKDYLGVIGFDDQVKWIVELKKGEDKEQVNKKIMSIRADGGTSIQPALLEAVEALEKNDAALKHIILLTDGQAEESGYEELLFRMNKAKISLSSVAVGKDADKTLLRHLANKGQGRYYETDVFTDIPTIFAKETALAGKKYLNHIRFFPKLEYAGNLFEGLDGIPPLNGYVASSEKPLARVILSGPDRTPILSIYHYGLGKTVAFCSDMHGLWSQDFLAWENNKIFWHRVLSEALHRKIPGGLELNSEYRDGKIALTLNLNPGSGIKEKTLKAKLVNGTEEEELILKLKAPYLYEAEFTPNKEGMYVLAGTDPSFAEPFIVPYSEEYRLFGQTRMNEDKLTGREEIRLIRSPEEIFEGKLPSTSKTYKLAKPLLILALLLFLLELCFRMTRIGDKLQRILAKLRKPKKLKPKKLNPEKKDKDEETEEERKVKGEKKTKKNGRNGKKKDGNETNPSSSHIDELLKDL